MDAWRTSCPRLPVWLDANDRELVETVHANGHVLVHLTPEGPALFKEQRAHSYAEPWMIRRPIEKELAACSGSMSEIDIYHQLAELESKLSVPLSLSADPGNGRCRATLSVPRAS